MKPFPDPLPARLLVVRGAHRIDLAMVDLIARLALTGPLRVLDGGNCINVYPLARALRRQTARLEPALRNVRLSRAFTCYQMLALLAETPAGKIPTLVLSLLDTFYDESVPLYETRRLLELALREMRRLCADAPLVVSARPPKADTADRMPFYETLLAAAHELY
jgi:hypothetical protein